MNDDYGTPPYNPSIPEPVLVDPPPEHLTSEGIYIPPSIRPHIHLDPSLGMSEERQIRLSVDPGRVDRWVLPSWGWVGVRSYYGHTDEQWEAFRRKVVAAYRIITEKEEGEKFRIVWLEDRERLDGAEGEGVRKAFQDWFLEHSDPPDGRFSVIPKIKRVWSGYETLVCLEADKETIDSVLEDSSKDLDNSASIKVVERTFDEQRMRMWAPRLVGRYSGSFKISPCCLNSLDCALEPDASYGQPGSASAWALLAAKTGDGVLRCRNKDIVDDEFGKDPDDFGDDSDSEEEE